MYLRPLLLLMLSFLYLESFSQNRDILNKASHRKKKLPPITEQFDGGYRLATDGWSLFLHRGFIRPDADKKLLIGLEFSEKKHPKEIRQQGNEAFASNFPNETKPLPFKFEKINNFYQLKFGVYQQKVISGILDKKSVVIHYIYGGAISLGLLKPYYVDALVPDTTHSGWYNRELIYFGQDSLRDAIFLNYDNVLGGGTVLDGINQIKVKPGLHLKGGFYFDYSPRQKTFLGMEIGTSLELYPKKIPIMGISDNKSVFWNFYADIRFGKRWRKDYSED